METLDLHSMRHSQVDRLVENFVLLNNLPVRIIVGNSSQMHTLVAAVLARHNLKSEPENYFNLGSLIIKSL